MNPQHWIFLSPHLDDVTLSCGALIWDLTRQGQRVEIWTLMAGIPEDENFSVFAQQMHHIWGMTGKEVVNRRQAEDRAACKVLGAQHRHLAYLDVIYRHDPVSGAPLVNNDDELFGKTPEKKLVEAIARKLQDEIPADAQVVLPMGLGNHVDHQAVAQAGEVLKSRRYYADYPYVLMSYERLTSRSESWTSIPYTFGENALTQWQDAVLCYQSQLSMFWRDEDEVRLALRNYLAGGGGRLWQKAVD